MKNGSITVYLSLTLMLCISIIFTFLESARIQGIKTYMIMGAESALDSAFAEYDRDMFEKYGITLFHGNMEEVMSEYLEYEYHPQTNKLGSGITWYSLNNTELSVEKVIRAVDYKGSIFAQLVVEYMKYSAVGDQTDQILEQLNILEKGESARKDTQEAKKEAESYAGGQDEKAEKTEYIEEKAYTAVFANNLVYRSQNDESREEKEERFDQERYKKEWEDSVIYDVEEIKKSGFMKYILPRGSALSGERIEQNDLPSCNIPSGEELKYGSGLDDAGRDLLFNMYVTSHFPSFVSKEKRSGVQYELEYILFGKKSDDENLKTSIERLLLIREGLNVIHITKSPEKMQAAMAMAISIMGWTQNPALIKLTQAAIIGAWAYGESIVDVRSLLGGGKINLIKSEEEWNLSLEGFVSFLSGTLTEGKEGKNGLTYTDYLRLLLFIEKKEDKYYRTMDMIQVNMKKTNPEFRMEECIFGVQMGLEVQASGIFSNFIQNQVGENFPKQYKYNFSVSRMY